MARGARPPTATKGKTPAKAAQVCRQRVLEDERLVSAQFGDYRTSYLGDPLKGSGAVMNHRPKLYNPDGSSGQPNP